MTHSLIFPDINEIIGSTERSGSNFMLFKLALQMSNIELEPGEPLSRIISKIDKKKTLSKFEFLSTMKAFKKLLLKKSNIFASVFPLFDTYKLTISDYRYKGNWLDFRSIIIGSQITKIDELSPWTNYILGLCQKEKKMLMASRLGRDLTTFFDGLSDELLIEKELNLEFKSLLSSAPKARVEFQTWENSNKAQLIRLESYIVIARLLNFLAVFEAMMHIDEPSYISSNTIYSSFIPKIENNKIRLPCYFFVEYLKKRIASSKEIKKYISLSENNKNPLSSQEKLAKSIENQLSNSDVYAETILKMFTRWQAGKTPLKPSKIKEYVNCYNYEDDKSNDLILSISPYIVNYLTQNIVTLQKNNSDKWIVNQFERYPLYRNKVFNQINGYR